MCGIAGIIDFSGRHPIHLLIERMTGVIRHRGPDDEGFALFSSSAHHVWGGPDTPGECYASSLPYTPNDGDRRPELDSAFLAMGHRRLSIIDVTPSGHQPMCYDSARYWIVFNGEVYNYLELRSELESLGHRFISSSDTEVVTASYKEWGNRCLQRFNGMFSFILYDRKKNVVFAARDRFAVKPFYYWRSPEGLLGFASEIKEFTVLPGWSPGVNPRRMVDFLVTGITDHTGETLFDGVFQLRGGEFFECAIDGLRSEVPVRRWYSVESRTSDPLEMDFPRAAEFFRSLFEDAVRLRLRADVPVGTGLSGGLDSSSIVCMVNFLLQGTPEGAQQFSFSACTDDARLDERPFIEEVVRKTGVNSLYTFPAVDDVFQVLPDMTWHHDEPFNGASVFAEWSVFRLVKTTPVKVTLDGHGADESLAGYHSFYWPYFADIIRKMQLGRAVREMRRVGSSTMKILQGTTLALLPPSAAAFLMRILNKKSETLDWIDWGRLGIANEWSWSERIQNHFRKTLRELSVDQLLRTSLPHQLRWCDRDSMASSVESRAPFLDYRVVEFLLRCPDSFKIGDAETKRILRQSMKDLLPRKVAERKDKIGFAMPEKRWVQGESALRFRGMFARSVDTLKPVLKEEGVRRAISASSGYNPALWRIMTLGAWADSFKIRL